MTNTAVHLRAVWQFPESADFVGDGALHCAQPKKKKIMGNSKVVWKQTNVVF